MAETAVELREEQLTRTIDQVLEQMKALVITNDDQYQVAGEWLKRNKETQKQVKDFYEPERVATYAAYTSVTSQIKGYLDPLGKGETTIKRKMGAYTAEQEQKRREEERRLAEEARKREEERRLQEAVDTGDETLLDEPIQVPIIHVEKPKPVEGISYADNWTFEIVDAGVIPRPYLMPDEKKIRAYVKALKNAGQIPGVRIFCEKSARVRS